MLGDRIRHMDDRELAEFLVWEMPNECEDPTTEELLPCFDAGCALRCPHDRRTENMYRWLTETY